ncbi:MAG: NADPH-dependent F420 reductase [Nitrososphaerota archaeon]|jgi:NADPH-dependent F420 reductase|nr:NADPH-dependent F420 reductase [Nitrososphaerota archaeon]MDG6927399.1 NADPH-dependent F420 reductase [Nitrososphaerota archaeon]MDG6931203.1 NADPH-dependent F420 reductase [Nitrososphaerota archaeon]MDG6931866.1 NADPH-dependent F420 reductase [Nitrososphaerota archaeon]MDG6936614.1 NADPH-dependent F420 reductase [Nitrososphaerota archaeon]
MKVSILGGTGDLGKGLALRLAESSDVIIGSRDPEKAKSIADQYISEFRASRGRNPNIVGMQNSEAVSRGEYIIISIPFEVLPQFLDGLVVDASRTVIVPVVPMKKTKEGFSYVPYQVNGQQLSAAELVRSRIGSQSVVSGFHTVPAMRLADLTQGLDYDVMVAADEKATYEKAAELIRSISGLKPIYAGKLYTSRYLEPLTPLLLNVAINNKLHAPSLKIV